jgi:Flp pilus assembly protein TadG
VSSRPSYRRPAALTRLRGDERGSQSITFAMVFPVILVLILLLVQCMLWWWAREVAQTAAREGVSVGRSYDNRNNDKAGPAEAQLLVSQLDGAIVCATPASKCVSQTNGPGANEITVTVVVLVQNVVPGLPRMKLTTEVTAPREAWCTGYDAQGICEPLAP